VIDTLGSSGLTPAAVEKIVRLGNDNICSNSIAQSMGCINTVVEAALFKPRRGRSAYMIFGAELRATDKKIQKMTMAQVVTAPLMDPPTSLIALATPLRAPL
jgi:hypothetical protein